MREFMQTVRSSPDPESDEIRATGAALSKLHEAIFSEQYSDDQEAPQEGQGRCELDEAKLWVEPDHPLAQEAPQTEQLTEWREEDISKRWVV
jgi:hypothetical protein